MPLHRQKRKPKKQEVRLKEGYAVIKIRPRCQSAPNVTTVFESKLLRIIWWVDVNLENKLSSTPLLSLEMIEPRCRFKGNFTAISLYQGYFFWGLGDLPNM